MVMMKTLNIINFNNNGDVFRIPKYADNVKCDIIVCIQKFAVSLYNRLLYLNAIN